MIGKVEANVCAEALEKILVEQTGADEARVESRKLTEEIVIDAKADQLDGLKVKRVVGLRKTGGIAATINQWRCASGIELHGVVEGDSALPVVIILEESELTSDAPVDAGESDACGADEVKMSKIAIFSADESASDLLIGIVAPGGRVGRGAGKDACGEEVMELATVITTVNGAETGCPGKV